MKKSCASIWKKQFAGRQNLYLKDPKSDFLVILNQKIYPLHKSFLEGVGYFASQQAKTEKVHILDLEIQEKQFQVLMGYIYGKELRFLRNWGVVRLFETARDLGISDLERQLTCEFFKNFDEYGFFLLFQMATKFNIEDLRLKCNQELVLMGFQQLNYNRYDLLQISRSTFEEIVMLHQLLKQNRQIEGFLDQDLKKIVIEYNQVNGHDIDLDNLLHYDASCHQIDSQSEEEDNITIRMRNLTWDGADKAKKQALDEEEMDSGWVEKGGSVTRGFGLGKAKSRRSIGVDTVEGLELLQGVQGQKTRKPMQKPTQRPSIVYVIESINKPSDGNSGEYSQQKGKIAPGSSAAQKSSEKTIPKLSAKTIETAQDLDYKEV